MVSDVITAVIPHILGVLDILVGLAIIIAILFGIGALLYELVKWLGRKRNTLP